MRRANLRTKQLRKLPFFPQLTYGVANTVIDFTPPANLVVNPGDVAGINIALSGKQETLHIRSEAIVEMDFERISFAVVEALFEYRDTWGKFGKQSVLVLDSSGNGAGSWEYENYNTFFDKAELDIETGVKPVRGRLRRGVYSLKLVFRQGV